MKSNKSVRNFSLLLWLCLAMTIIWINPLMASDDVLINALNDEIARSLTGLKLEDNAPPYYMGRYLAGGRTQVEDQLLFRVYPAAPQPIPTHDVPGTHIREKTGYPGQGIGVIHSINKLVAPTCNF